MYINVRVKNIFSPAEGFCPTVPPQDQTSIATCVIQDNSVTTTYSENCGTAKHDSQHIKKAVLDNIKEHNGMLQRHTAYI
jgi:hypothetical protein